MGIREKMEADIKRDPSIRDMFNDEAFWTPTNVIAKETLTMGHILPSFLVLAFGLFSSVIVIVLEKMLCIHDKTTFAKPTLQNDSCKVAGESEDKTAIEISTHEGTVEPNEKISPELEMENKKPNIGKEKDNDVKMMILAEIQEELCKEESTRGNSQYEPFTGSVTSINSLSNMETDRIGLCETVLQKGNTNIIENKTKLDHNLSRGGTPDRNSPQWSEIIDFLDNEEATTGQFLDQEKSTTLTPVISPGLEIPNNIDSGRASSQGSADNEEENIESILTMPEIHETPNQEMNG